jgi:hypothetical protein
VLWSALGLPQAATRRASLVHVHDYLGWLSLTKIARELGWPTTGPWTVSSQFNDWRWKLVQILSAIRLALFSMSQQWRHLSCARRLSTVRAARKNTRSDDVLAAGTPRRPCAVPMTVSSMWLPYFPSKPVITADSRFYSRGNSATFNTIPEVLLKHSSVLLGVSRRYCNNPTVPIAVQLSSPADAGRVRRCAMPAP